MIGVVRCRSKDKKRGLNAVQASRPRYSAIPVLSIQLQVSSWRIRESFVRFFSPPPQEPFPKALLLYRTWRPLSRDLAGLFRFWTQRISRPAFSSGGMWGTRLYRVRQAWAAT
jgi:hypothetical protein